MKKQLSGGQLSGGNCPGGNCPGGNCPGAIVQGAIVRGAIVRGAIVWGAIVLEPNYPLTLLLTINKSKKTSQHFLKINIKQTIIQYDRGTLLFN